MRPSARVLARREEVIKLLSRYPSLSNLRICGSVARGEDNEDSDIDFLVDPGPGTTLFDLGGLHEDLEELLGVPVDIISTRARLDTEMKERLLREAISI
ncbi:MAG: nucleotidyltransferase family protein [Planctomycetaceae bacterium]|nr:nucleotidyltransferase family protein [Planctomycetaceae bacterium]